MRNPEVVRSKLAAAEIADGKVGHVVGDGASLIYPGATREDLSRHGLAVASDTHPVTRALGAAGPAL